MSSMAEASGLLALDTATQVSSVAVISGKKLAAELTVQGRLTHSETLVPHIRQVLQMAELKKEQLTGIAVSQGPGSFTGLRIGLAAAKAMAYALGLPLVGVPTPAVLACQCPVPGLRLVTLLDAQKGNAYVQSFRWARTQEQGEEGWSVEGLHLHPLHEVQVAPLKETVKACGAVGEPVLLLGDVVQKKIAGRLELPDNVNCAPRHLVMPRAACVAQLGLSLLAAGRTANVMDFEPLYVRRSEAEVLWEKRHPEQIGIEEPDCVLKSGGREGGHE